MYLDPNSDATAPDAAAEVTEEMPPPQPEDPAESGANDEGKADENTATDDTGMLSYISYFGYVIFVTRGHPRLLSFLLPLNSRFIQ